MLYIIFIYSTIHLTPMYGSVIFQYAHESKERNPLEIPSSQQPLSLNSFTGPSFLTKQQHLPPHFTSPLTNICEPADQIRLHVPIAENGPRRENFEFRVYNGRGTYNGWVAQIEGSTDMVADGAGDQSLRNGKFRSDFEQDCCV